MLGWGIGCVWYGGRFCLFVGFRVGVLFVLYLLDLGALFSGFFMAHVFIF